MIADLIINVFFFVVRLMFVIFPSKSVLPEFFQNAWDFGFDQVAKILYLMPSGFQTIFLAVIQVVIPLATVVFGFLIIRNVYGLIRGGR